MHPRLTLLSNSSNHSGGYLGHAIEEIASLFQGIRRVAFIPFALHDHPGHGARPAGSRRASFRRRRTRPGRREHR